MDGFHLLSFHQHSVIKHQKYLERKITDVDLVLRCLLQQNLITKDQHNHVLCKTSDQQKMKELYQFVRLWKTKEQDKFYMVLREQHFTIIRDMEMAERKLKCGFKPLSPTTEAFLRNQRLQLIEKVMLVDPVLDDLVDQDVLEKKQYDNIKSYSTEQKMKELLDISSDWGDYAKCLLYQALYRHNSLIIKDLERSSKKHTKAEPKPVAMGSWCKIQHYKTLDLGKNSKRSRCWSTDYGSRSKTKSHKTTDPDWAHFLDRHCWDLIRLILMVDPVLDDLLDEKLLTSDQYNEITKMKTSRTKMVELSEIISKWKHKEKDKVYLALRQHNFHYIRRLEKLEGTLATNRSTREHFVVRHWYQLITRAKMDPVLDDLKAQNVIPQEQCANLQAQETFEEKMDIFHNVVTSWQYANKDMFYLSLRKHNYSIIRELENNDKQANRHISGYFETPVVAPSSHAEDGDKEWVSVRLAITCSVCMDIFTHPVTLACGHSFCLGCITRTWNEQFQGESSCPHCRQRFKKKPDLKRNLTLSQIAECYQSSQPDCGATSHGCSYCTHTTVPPVRVCLLCDSFLCNDHLNVHCGVTGLLEPMISMENRKCSIHNKVLEYYCEEDSWCLCASCCIIGEHRGHQVERLIDASVKKKEKLRNFQENLVLNLSVLSANIQDLKDCKMEMEVFYETELYLCPASKEDKTCQYGPPNGDTTLLKLDPQCISSLVQQLEMKYQELSKKVEYIENVCHMTDALMVIREPKSESANFYHCTMSDGLMDPFHQHFRILQSTYL